MHTCRPNIHICNINITNSTASSDMLHTTQMNLEDTLLSEASTQKTMPGCDAHLSFLGGRGRRESSRPTWIHSKTRLQNRRTEQMRLEGGSVVGSNACCSSRRPQFDSQHTREVAHNLLWDLTPLVSRALHSGPHT